MESLGFVRSTRTEAEVSSPETVNFSPLICRTNIRPRRRCRRLPKHRRATEKGLPVGGSRGGEAPHTLTALELAATSGMLISTLQGRPLGVGRVLKAFLQSPSTDAALAKRRTIMRVRPVCTMRSICSTAP